MSVVDQYRPQRWNWSIIVRPLDASVARQAQQPLEPRALRGLRFFWLDGLFAAISENFYVSFIPLFALAYGATNGQVGWVTAIGNLMGALALFPGARMVERVGRRKPIILVSGGGFGRLSLLLLGLVPFVFMQPHVAILAIVVFNGLRAFMFNFSNPAWTALVADLVPDTMRGRYFSARNVAMGLAALAVAPIAGRLIVVGNGWNGWPYMGYSTVFFLAFLFGVIGTLSFSRIPEPEPSAQQVAPHQRGDLRRALRESPEFVGLVISAFMWNLSIQVAGPFFNVYLVSGLGGTTATVGILASVTSASALAGQAYFGRALDRRGALWVQMVSGFCIGFLPLGWLLVTAPWQVGFISLFGGFMWAGYNLSNFNLLLELTPDAQRPRAVALFQTVVFGSAFLGPVLGGYVADAFGYTTNFAISGGGRLVAMVLFVWLSVRPARRRGKAKIED
jgi:MFS family permease